MKDGQPQRSDARLFMQFLAFGGCPDAGPLIAALGMADMAGVGVLNLSVLKTHAYALDGVNDALAEVKTRPGGLGNIVVNPDR